MKKEQGITLISLVVTIIVLIILAGVSINLILGQDGIINKAKEAKQNMELATIEEQEQLNELYAQMSGESNGSLSYDAMAKLIEFKRQIASAITDMGVETASNADATTMINNIKSISGASSADKISYNNTNSGLAATNLQSAVDELDSINDSLEIKTYTDEEVITFTNENFSLKTAVADISNGMCTINVKMSVPNNTIFNTSTIIAKLPDNILPRYYRNVVCGSWGGRCVGHITITTDGVVYFAMTNAYTGETDIDMYFEVTYRIK